MVYDHEDRTVDVRMTPRGHVNVSEGDLRTDMEYVLVKGQGEAVSMTVVVDTASVPGYCVGGGGGERVRDRRVVSLICAGWLPQDGRFGW